MGSTDTTVRPRSLNSALKLAGLGADVALTDVHRESEDLPPGEVRAGWRGIDTVAEEVAALGRRC
ncbi:MAG: hypothetical protein QF473_19625, partial [Planctomycetota bacterium]|nr:hypothetical protein [Planctomycetota bacterium]